MAAILWRRSPRIRTAAKLTAIAATALLLGGCPLVPKSYSCCGAVLPCGVVTPSAAFNGERGFRPTNE
jgi:hypothetical protein